MSQTKAQLLDNIKDNVQLDARNALRFADTDSSHYVAFKAPATVSSNVTWTLPAADGSANYVLATDGSGNLSWIADPAGQWVTSGSNIYFTGGNVGIGDSSPSNPLSVTGASAFNGDVQFTGASYNVTWDKSADDLIFNDNAQACFGTGSDVKIYHTGSHSYIDNDTGNLYIRNNVAADVGGDIHIRAKAGENSVSCLDDGEVQLSFDGNEKLNTVTDGINITGSLQFGDDTNTYLQRSAADTLQLVTGGTAALTVDSSQRIGIGTASPTGIHNLAKVLEISGGDGGDLIIGNSVSTNIGTGAHIGSIAFKNIDNSTGSSPHYAGIRCEATDTSGNMDLRFYTGIANLEADTPQVYINSTGLVGIGTVSPDNILHVSSGSDNICALFESTDAEAQIRIKDTTGTAILACKNDFSFENSTTGSLVRITADGNAGIGTTSPKAFTGQTHLTINQAASGTQVAGISFRIGNASAGDILTYPSNDEGLRLTTFNAGKDITFYKNISASDTILGRFYNEGNFEISDGDLVVASGHGIDFSATANGSGTTTSELLDDYEEGTWTPVPTLGSGTTGMTYEYAPTGVYTKIGRVVTVRFGWSWTSKGSSTGALQVTGLPFTASHTAYNHFTGAVIVFNGPNADGSMTSFISTATINFRMQNEANDNAAPNENDVDNDTKMMGTITYQV